MQHEIDTSVMLIKLLLICLLFHHYSCQLDESIKGLVKEIFPSAGQNPQNSGNTSTREIQDLLQQVFPKDNSSTTTNNRMDSSTETVNLSPESGGGNSNCVCVPYYHCNNGTIIKDGMGLIDIRIQDNQCSNYLEICCGMSQTVPEPITPAPDPEKATGCGHHNPEGVGFRITGNKDNEAQFGEFPWMVAILRQEELEGSQLNVYQCGGALIHPKVVLTAGHCVTDKNKKFKVRAGEWDTQTKKELFPHQDRNVEKILIHPEYYAGALYNDVALLFLETPVDLAENVNVVCLPPQGVVIDHARCFASGWGKDVFGKEGRYQVILKKIDLPIVPRAECQTSLRTTRLGKFFELHNSFVCAGGEAGKDTCKGDGGSPLVCPIPGTKDMYQQVGIVAWGIGCGENQIPGVYANVALFRNWIDEQLKSNKLDNSVYKY